MLGVDETNESPSILLIMPPASAAHYTRLLTTFRATTVTDYASASSCIAQCCPDAIIAEETPDAMRIFADVRHMMLSDERPLLLIAAAEFAAPPVLADGSITPVSAPHMLSLLLRLRAEKLALVRRVTDLAATNTQLHNDLQHERRLKNEIEVLKNAIVRNVSHELKTPLLQVKSAVALLAEDGRDEKLVEYATGATARLETLVKNITMLGGSLETNLGPVILRDATEYARRNLRRIWEHRDHTARIDVDLAPHLPPVLADKQGLSTVLQLLLDNALKFSKAQVELSAHHYDESSVVVSVRDYGIGIAKDQLHTIFDSFYQGDSSSTRRYGGMGVGLAIVRLILDAHHTHIHVESELGKGSLFWFLLKKVNL